MDHHVWGDPGAYTLLKGVVINRDIDIKAATYQDAGEASLLRAEMCKQHKGNVFLFLFICHKKG